RQSGMRVAATCAPRLRGAPMFLSHRPPRRRGFTLIEMVVTVVIVAVLAAVAVIAYGRFAGSSRGNATVASATEIRDALTARAAQDDRSPAVEAAALWTAEPTSGGFL